MVVDAPTPLASVADMQKGPFADLVRAYSPDAMADLMIEATRACETECDRRLALFTGVVETHRLEGMDPDEYTDAANLPMDLQGTLGRSYAHALGASTLVRHMWLNEYATLFPDMWTCSIQTLQIFRSYGGSQILSSLQYVGPELDSGHVWFNLGQFIPIGSLGRVTYSGGYSTVPADLKRGCMWMAASIAAAELDPMQATHGHDPGALEAKAVAWLSAYQRQT